MVCVRVLIFIVHCLMSSIEYFCFLRYESWLMMFPCALHDFASHFLLPCQSSTLIRPVPYLSMLVSKSSHKMFFAHIFFLSVVSHIVTCIVLFSPSSVLPVLQCISSSLHELEFGALTKLRVALALPSVALDFSLRWVRVYLAI